MTMIYIITATALIAVPLLVLRGMGKALAKCDAI